MTKKKNNLLFIDTAFSYESIINRGLENTINYTDLNSYFNHVWFVHPFASLVYPTNDKKIYELTRLLRSHGMARELSDKNSERKIIKKSPDLSPNFIFLYPSYNVRNNEISAVLGLNQLKSLNRNNEKRKKNFKIFLKYLNNKNPFKLKM